MASPRLAGFINDCQTLITNELQFADAWEALKQEYTAFGTNGITITDADVADLGVTAAQFLAALAAMHSVVDFIHVPATAAKLYRVRR
jgi:hypothetical protein